MMAGVKVINAEPFALDPRLSGQATRRTRCQLPGQGPCIRKSAASRSMCRQLPCPGSLVMGVILWFFDQMRLPEGQKLWNGCQNLGGQRRGVLRIPVDRGGDEMRNGT